MRLKLSVEHASQSRRDPPTLGRPLVDFIQQQHRSFELALAIQRSGLGIEQLIESGIQAGRPRVAIMDKLEVFERLVELPLGHQLPGFVQHPLLE